MTSPPSWGQAHQGHGGSVPYGGEHGAWEPAPPARNGLGVAALTLALLGALLFWTVLGGVVLGLLALIFGVVGHRRGRRGEATNGTMALVGAVIGALALVGSTVVLVFVASVLSSGDYGELEKCASNATTQAEQEQCRRDFVDSISP